MKRRRERKRFRVPAAVTAFGLILAAVGLALLFWLGPRNADQLGSQPARGNVSILRGGDAWGGGASGSSGSGNVISGPVTHVRDGDTIEVAGTPIRFAKLDCAERGTAQGRRATAQMKSLVSGKTLSCTLTGRKSYDRWIGSCRLQDGRDLGAAMLESGACNRW